MGTRRPSRRLAACAAAIVLVAGLVVVPGTAAAKPRNPVDLLNCVRSVNPAVPGDVENLYGPTHVNATSGNGGLSVGANHSGTLSVLRWPSPSYHDHVKYLTSGRGLPRWGAYENEGVFSGIAWDGGFFWLRDADVVEQSFAGDRTDTVVTAFEHAASGISVEVRDTVDPDRDVLVRRHSVAADPASGIDGVRLIGFANLNPTTKKLPGIPVWDGCLDQYHDAPAEWNVGADGVVHAARGYDAVAGRTNSVAIALGWTTASSAHDVGPDTHALPMLPSLSQGPYDAITASGGSLLGRDAASGQVASAVATDIELDSGAGESALLIAAADASDSAVSLLETARGVADDVEPRKQAYWDDWLSGAALPNTDDDAVVSHSLRALISLAQATDRETGAIVASISSQPPYSLDWIRDGAYFNEALHAAGHPEMVDAHNRFYTTVIVRPGQRPPGAVLTPHGNWPMNTYADGVLGGPIPFEIDETGFGIWTLVRHYDLTGDTDYLRAVWPTVRAAAQFLTRWENPFTGLALPAFEDDNFELPNPPTLVSSAPVGFGLQSAIRAAEALGESADAERWTRRFARLEAAIERHYAAGPDGNAYGRLGGDYVIWPLRFRPYATERMQAQAELVWSSAAPSFTAPESGREAGQYEGRALLALAKMWSETNPERLDDVRRGLDWLANENVSEGTGLKGEAWYARDGAIVTSVAMPHVWAQVLFYLTALEAYPA